MERSIIDEVNIPLGIREEMDNKEVKQIADVLPKQEPAFPELEQIDVESLINVPIVIVEVKFFPSTFDEGKEFIVAKIMTENKLKKIINGSKVIVEKLKKITKEFPIGCKIVRKTSAENRKYYDLE